MPLRCVVLILGLPSSALPALAAAAQRRCAAAAALRQRRPAQDPGRKWTGRALRRQRHGSGARTRDHDPERPAGNADAGSRDCANCPPPKHYDSTEVIKKSRDVDQSRVINTESVVEVPSEDEREQQAHRPRERDPQRRRDPAQPQDHREGNPLREARAGLSAPRSGASGCGSRPCLCPVVQQTPCGCPCSCGGGSHGGYAQAYAQTYVYAEPHAYARPTTQ